MTRLVLTLLMFCFGAMPVALFASPRVGSIIDQAEEARSADPALFSRLLIQLNELKSEASPAQRNKIEYLDAYADAYSGKCDQSIRKAEELIGSAADPDLKARSSALIVLCYAQARKFLQGLRELDRLNALTSRATMNETRQHSLFASANLYNQVGQYGLGLRDVSLLLDGSGPVVPRNRCFAEQLRLELRERMGIQSSDTASIEKLIDTCSGLHEPMVANFGRLVLAHQYVDDGRRPAAEALLEQHLTEIDQTHYPLLIGNTRALLAQLKLKDGDLAAAEKYAQQAIAGGAYDRGILPLVTANQVLYEIAQRRGDIAAALRHYQDYAEADKAYLNEVKTRELAYQMVRQEGEQKNQQIQLLNRQNSLLQLQQRVDKQKAENSRLLMLLFAVFALITAYWGYKTKRLHASLRRMAETDALTGICNRHHFTVQAEKALAVCDRAGEQVSLIMFDLDHFKTINDSYGHVTGDWVLKEVAKTCAELCRRMDYFGRLGGEEFAILLHGCDLKAATRIAEDCRMRISRIKTLDSGYNFPVTASFGVSCSTVAAYDLDKLMSLADQMLYRAKREGRNRVKAFVHDLPAETREPAPRRDDDEVVDAIVPAVRTLNA